ncbi:hypothetical protein FQN54_008016 [Arachnomyces sp. PD_36]|nr:hypothetical protein FQN54_008016 [Arachnomyces sp. PD_36]
MKSFVPTLWLMAAPFVAARYCMYIDQYHTTTYPNKTLTAGIDHVIMGFAPSNVFTTDPPKSYTPFQSVESIRALFDDGAKVSLAIGGWGDTEGFSQGAKDETSRQLYAKNVASVIDQLGFDGVDVDWEYPGGNGDNYKQIPNTAKVSEIETYPLLLAEIKNAIGSKELSIAVPGLKRDMIAYTEEQAPKIWEAVDFVNVMSYDLMNRRDNVTKHHSSVEGSLESIETYLDLGLPPAKANLGFAFYTKYFTTADGADCGDASLGCETAVLEAADGTDTGLSGALTFETVNYPAQNLAPRIVPTAADWQNALQNAQTDEEAGGEYYWDPSNKLFWTWDTPALIAEKFEQIVAAKKLGGVMAWSLAEDSYDWSHLEALQTGVNEYLGGSSTKRAFTQHKQKFRRAHKAT